MSNDQLQLEYSLQELPNLMALEIRQNMLWDKNKKLWPEAVEKFSQSIAKQNPLSSYIHKNMNTKRLGKHRIEIRLDGPFLKGRGRINCTMAQIIIRLTKCTF